MILSPINPCAQVLERNFKVKIIAMSERGQLTCTVQASRRTVGRMSRIVRMIQSARAQVFSIAPGLYLVDWRRGMGDAMSFYKFYQASYTRADQTYMMRSSVVTNLHYGRRACARASPASSRAANRNDAAAAALLGTISRGSTPRLSV